MLVTTLIAAAAQMSAAGGLAAIERWNLDMRSTCELSRRFGDANSPVIAALRLWPVSKTGSLSLLLRSSDTVKAALNAEIGGNADTQPIRVTFKRPDQGQFNGILSAPLERAQIAQLLQAETWSITGLTKEPISLRVDGSRELAAQLASCDKEMVEAVGVDPTQDQSVEGPIIKDNDRFWISDSNYPPTALRARQEGTTTVAWEVPADGMPRNCRVVRSSGFPVLDDATCKLILERVKYRRAAVDKDGRPVSSWQMRVVNWRLPPRPN